MPALTREAEVDLARRWRDHKDKTAHDRLIMSQRRNVLYLAYKYMASAYQSGCRDGHVELNDFVQAGWRGVSRAAIDFDPERGIRFSTYSIYWIHAFISRTSKKARHHAVMTTSLEFPVFSSDHEALTLGDVLPTDGHELIESEGGLDFRSYLKVWTKLLNQRERHIIERRYRAKVMPTLGEVGKELGLTRERVRQIEALAIAKIRKYVTAVNLPAVGKTTHDE